MIDYGDRARLGILVPSGNTVAEPELRAMLPSGVGMSVARLPLVGSSEAELRAMIDRLEEEAVLNWYLTPKPELADGVTVIRGLKNAKRPFCHF